MLRQSITRAGRRKATRTRAFIFIGCACLVLQAWATAALAQSAPSTVIPIGDGHYALDLAADGSAAVVSLLFPAADDDPNLFWVDLQSAAVVDQFRFGRRLFRISIR